jgi:toxin CptA
MHGAAAMAVWMADMDWRYRVVMWTAVAFWLLLFLRKKPHATLRCRDDGGLDVRTGEHWQPVSLLPDSLVWPWLVVLRYRQEGRRAVSVPLLQDSMSAEEFRRLKVWAKWRAATGVPADPSHAR